MNSLFKIFKYIILIDLGFITIIILLEFLGDVDSLFGLFDGYFIKTLIAFFVFCMIRFLIGKYNKLHENKAVSNIISTLLVFIPFCVGVLFFLFQLFFIILLIYLKIVPPNPDTIKYLPI